LQIINLLWQKVNNENALTPPPWPDRAALNQI